MHIPVYVLTIGLLAQIFFTARVLFQWILSEKAKKVVSPSIYWILSLAGSYLLFAYGWLRDDFSIMLGQIIGYYVYIWNLQLKGVWNRMGFVMRRSVIVILCLTPIVATGALIYNNNLAQLTQSFFHNSDVPIWLLIFGSVGQVIFSLRFIYQWYYSSKKHLSIMPTGFWIISAIGSLIILVYGTVRLDPVLLLAQGFGAIVYGRNIYLCYKYGTDENEVAIVKD